MSKVKVVQDAIESFIESLYILNVKDLYQSYVYGALLRFNVLQYMYEVFPDLCLKNT